MAPSIETSMWMALKGRIASLALTPSIPVVYPKQDAPSSGRYILVAYMPNRVARLMVNSGGSSERPGILQLSVMSPLPPADVAEVDMEIAGKIAAHFPADLPLEHNGVRVRVTEAPSVAMGFRDDDAARWHTPVTIRFESLI
jgi:hypothetical protein